MSVSRAKSASVIGLGRVGLMTLFHLADKGYRLYGLDINKELINNLQHKTQPFAEPQFNKLLKRYHKKIQFLTGAISTQYHFICVPTPFHSKTHQMDLSCIRSALKQIKKSSIKPYVFIRSTLTPGTCAKLSDEFKHLFICYFPEFFREGCFFKDYKNISFSVLGSQQVKKFPHFSQFQFSKKTVFCSLEEAEILKMACNLFHGLKVSFANEIGRIAKNFKASPDKIMEIFSKDKALNISEKYLRPGFAYGGPCLSKDIRSLHSIQDSIKNKWILPQSVEYSNTLHVQWVAEQILNSKPKKIGILGCSFTGNPTYDCRQSSVLKLAEILSANKNVSLYGIEKSLNQYKCHILPEKSLNQLMKCDICILGGWSPFLKSLLFADYKGILFDLLVQNVPKEIKNHPNYTTAFS